MMNVDVPRSAWELLGLQTPTSLTETRLELHSGLQVAAAVPQAFCEAVPDTSHSNFGWSIDHAAFVSRAMGRQRPARIGLLVRDFALALLAPDGTIADRFALGGERPDSAYAWAARAMESAGVGAVDPQTLRRPDGGFASQNLNGGASFTGGDPATRVELARWYDNALLVLSEVARSEAGASDVRTWPHHFDMATLITLEPAEAPEGGRSVGVGMSPGDASYAEPYFYMIPHPYPQRATLSPLAGRGLWHMEGWTGAVLTGSRLVEGADEPAQAKRVRSFLASAIPAGRRLAGG